MTNIFFVKVKIVIDLYKIMKPELKITMSLSDMFKWEAHVKNNISVTWKGRFPILFMINDGNVARE